MGGYFEVGAVFAFDMFDGLSGVLGDVLLVVPAGVQTEKLGLFRAPELPVEVDLHLYE